MKLYMFRTVPLSTIRSFSLYTQQWYVIQLTVTACEQGQDVRSVLILLASCNCNLYNKYHCCVYCKKKLLMRDRRTVRNM